MKVALFGGTFNPVHYGHLLMAEYARQSFNLQKVIFVPAGLPPHRQTPKTSIEHRMAMVRLAIRGNPFFTLSDWEVRQRRIVYTYETMAHFTTEKPNGHYFFILGSDSLAQLPLWRHSAYLLAHYDFLIVQRPGAPWKKIPAGLRNRVHLVPSEPVPFAGHEIRNRVRRGLSVRYQVPEPVNRYIQSHRLYRKPE